MMDNLMLALEVMGKGMLGIFAVILLIMLIVMLLTKIPDKKKDKE